MAGSSRPRATQAHTSTRSRAAAPPTTQSRAARATRSAAAPDVDMGTDVDADDSEEDPLAMTPLPARTQRRSARGLGVGGSSAASDMGSVSGSSAIKATRSATRRSGGGRGATQAQAQAQAPGSKRRAAPAGASTRSVRGGAERIVGGVEMDEGDLVPPSDEDEFDDWAEERAVRKEQRERGRTGSRAITEAGASDVFVESRSGGDTEPSVGARTMPEDVGADPASSDEELFELGPTQTLPDSPRFFESGNTTPTVLLDLSPRSSPAPPSSPSVPRKGEGSPLALHPSSPVLGRSSNGTPVRPLGKSISAPERSPQFTHSPKRRCLPSRSEDQISHRAASVQAGSPPQADVENANPTEWPTPGEVDPHVPYAAHEMDHDATTSRRAPTATPELIRSFTGNHSSSWLGSESPLSEPPPTPPAASPIRAAHQSRSPTPRQAHAQVVEAHPMQLEPELADPALMQFRQARSFRTRTTLQLQPYTRERQIYEAALRRGGFKSTKEAAPTIPEEPSATQPSSDWHETMDAGVSTEPSILQSTPEVVLDVIQRPNRPRPVYPVESVDRDGFHVQHSRSADEADEDDARALQSIVRRRRKEEREQRARDKESRRMGRELARAAREARAEQEMGSRQAIKSATGSTAYGKRARKSIPKPAPPPTREREPLSPEDPRLVEMLRHLVGSPGSSPESPVVQHHVADLEENDFEMLHARSPPQAVEDEAEEGSEESSPGGTDDEEVHRDGRSKIARRMLPAAMLKRLEREAALKQLDGGGGRRRELESKSPARPGHAVRRRGPAAEVDFAQLAGSSDTESDDMFAADYGPGRNNADAIEISDDSDGSQAEEVNHAQETLARLYKGDFESIAVGRPTHAAPRKRTERGKAARRPAMRIDVRPRHRPTKDGKGMVQSRLDFERAPIRREGVSKGQSRGASGHKASRNGSRPTATGPRPAIRLDDQVIFGRDDFAFDEPDIVPSPAPRSAKQVDRDDIDQGVGKARSWANFEHFPVDFGIRPLPTGLYCASNSIIGQGLVRDLVDFLGGAQGDRPEPCVAHEIAFEADMSLDDLTTIWPSYVAALLTALGDGEPDLGGLEYLACRLADGVSDDIDFERLAEAIRRSIPELSVALDGERRLRDDALTARWRVLDVALRLARVGSVDDAECAKTDAISLLSRLLALGVERVVKPLKEFLRGESLTGKVTDDLVIAWVSVVQALEASMFDWVPDILLPAIDRTFAFDSHGPIAAERVWYLAFVLSALSQFDSRGKIDGEYRATPRWVMVRHAIGLIKLSHSEEAEEKAHAELLKGRDRYVRAILARCVRLSSVWRWHFDRESFSVATKDLGVIFKNRQHRNFPTEPPVDYPSWITQFDITRTGNDAAKRETAFELYLRLVCVAAADIIGAAQSLQEAQQAEKDIQRLIMSIIPVSSVRFNRLLPPTARQVGQLINRYSTMIAACYFSPGILSWLLMTSQHWAPFEKADFQSRQLSIRGLMYLAIACRHHRQPVEPVVSRLAAILKTLQGELDIVGAGRAPGAPGVAVGKVEVHRTMVLVVSCFRQIILHHSFEPSLQATPCYPDPALLHESWTARIFDLSVGDPHSGLEIVRTIQAFLDIRLQALPDSIRRMREARLESQDEYGSLGFELDLVTVAQLGGDVPEMSLSERQDAVFANILKDIISPRIYRLLSDMLPADVEQPSAQRNLLLDRLARCWFDCAAVLVIDHRLSDWSIFVSPYGSQSIARLANEEGRTRVGLIFMTQMLLLDKTAIAKHPDEFNLLFFDVVGNDKYTVEHEYIAALIASASITSNSLFEGAAELRDWRELRDVDVGDVLSVREALLDVVFTNMARMFGEAAVVSGQGAKKSFLYRCINQLVACLKRCLNNIPEDRVIHRESYRLFVDSTIHSLRTRLAAYVNDLTVSNLRTLVSAVA